MIPINKENDLFAYLRSTHYPDLVKARNQMSTWDCYSPDSSHRIELKCRTKHYETLLIEKKKFDSMLEICQRHFDIPIYICSTPMGVFSFNLLGVSPQWEVNSRNPSTSWFNNRSRVEKEVAYLNVKDAVVL